ncbi:MAG TPA: hypothetical protein VL172_03490, partial [Kofleriaceae bacterium]|nr:hypothetical protein [Kofleriaceae bacterium]
MGQDIRAFDGIDDIDWDELEHAYGSAGDIPGFLRDLASGDADKRGNARYWLGANIVHQGSLYSASAPAVPFLVRLAGEPAVAEREHIVRLLADLAVSEAA